MASSDMAVEFGLGGLAASIAAVFSNPPEVVKTRMQLQGELQARGAYAVVYKNPFHAAYTIATHEGIAALQKGLGPAIAFQFAMNSTRLGTFQTLLNAGWLEDEKGRTIHSRTILAGTVSGAMGGVVASPLYLVKTHMQSMASSSETAVGHQYHHRSAMDALRSIYAEHGITGLWRGTSGAVPRLMVGSAAQLSTFHSMKEELASLKSSYLSHHPAIVPALASLLSSFVVVICMTPFDVVSTRLYNQPVGKDGKGVLYKGFFDAFIKVSSKEGVFGLYKGWLASYCRIGPHNIICLSVWDYFRRLYVEQQKRSKQS